MAFKHKLSRRLAQNDPRLAIVLIALAGCAGAVTDSQIDIAEIRVSPRSALVPPNGTVRFTATGRNTAAEAIAVPVLWSAEGGTIDENGVFRAGTVDGAYRVFATHATLQWLTDSSTAVVLAGPTPVGIRLYPRDPVVPQYETVTLTAFALYATGDSAAVDVAWSVESGTLERGNGKGQGRYKNGAPGRYKVRVEADTLADSVTVTVTPVTVASVTVTPDSASLNVGDTLRLVAVARDSAGTVLSGQELTWSSGAGSVATVSATGLVTAQSGGATAVTVTCGGQSTTATIVVTAAPPPPPPPPPGDSLVVIFQDDFESGNLSRTSPDFRWGASNGEPGATPRVATDIARSGSNSLKFIYLGNPNLADDAWSEQRFLFPNPLTEVYLEWYQFFPMGTEGVGPKFVYRNADGSDNNKFAVMWDEDYNNYKIFASFEMEINSGPDPKVVTKYGKTGTGVGNFGSGQWMPGITDAYRGRWVRFMMRVKAATAANNDGVIELWADGVKVVSNTTLPLYPTGGVGNYLRNGYLMGWANTGFDQTTYVYIDDVRLMVPAR